MFSAVFTINFIIYFYFGISILINKKIYINWINIFLFSLIINLFINSLQFNFHSFFIVKNIESLNYFYYNENNLIKMFLLLVTTTFSSLRFYIKKYEVPLICSYFIIYYILQNNIYFVFMKNGEIYDYIDSTSLFSQILFTSLLLYYKFL